MDMAKSVNRKFRRTNRAQVSKVIICMNPIPTAGYFLHYFLPNVLCIAIIRWTLERFSEAIQTVYVELRSVVFFVFRYFTPTFGKIIASLPLPLSHRRSKNFGWQFSDTFHIQVSNVANLETGHETTILGSQVECFCDWIWLNAAKQIFSKRRASFKYCLTVAARKSNLT